MDVGYQSFSFSSQTNHAARSDHLSQYFPPIPLEQPALESLEIPRISQSTPSMLGAAPSAFDFSAPQLVDYSIFDTPVDISVGALPPRPTTSRALAQGRVPRPRNAFMLFRSTFHREKHLLKSVEKDHRHISRIIGLCWADLPEAEKDVWRQKAELEKQQHALDYPDYRFKPTPRTKQPVKRNVKRNSAKEIERCRKIAELIQTGKSGEELTHAVKRMDGEMPSTSAGGGVSSGKREGKVRKRRTIADRTRSSDPPTFTEPQLSRCVSAVDEYPPFRSPLLPLPDLPQTSSKRPYPVAVPPCLSRTQQPVTSNSQQELFDTSRMTQPHSNQEYMFFRQADQGAKYPQRPESQLQHHFFEWPSKEFLYGPESIHYPHYSATSAREPTHASYTLDNQFIPSGFGWSSYYRPSVLADNAAPTSSTYGSWYDDMTGTPASSVGSK